MKQSIVVLLVMAGSAYAIGTAGNENTSVDPAPAPVAGAEAAGTRANQTSPRPAVPAAAATIKPRTPCIVIASLPYTISAPGRYCYASDLASDGPVGVAVQASGVDLDCANFATTTSPQSPAAFTAVFVAAARSVTIRNCRIGGFDYGILASGDSAGLRVFDNRIDRARIAGVSANGDGVQVVGNRITHMMPAQIGGELTAISLGSPSAGARVSGVAIAGNVIVNLSGSSNIAGIRVAQADAPMIYGNTVMELRPSSQGRAVALSLRGPGSGSGSNAAAIVENQLMSRSAPSMYADFEIESPGAFGRCVDNVLIGSNPSLITQCTSGSGNVVVP